MAYDYKYIGNTAAKVVSILALGTTLYWARTPSDPPIPQPPDEAELMTGILERHFARNNDTNYSFVASIPANISTRIVGIRTNIDSVVPSTYKLDSTLSSGTNAVLYSWNKGMSNIFPHNVEIPPDTWVSIGEYLAFYVSPPNQAYAYIFYDVAGDHAVYWQYTGTTLATAPATIQPSGYRISTGGPFYPYGSYVGALTISPGDGRITNFSYTTIYTNITNSAAMSLTNTIGFFPNATFQYPDTIRSALVPCAGSFGTANACKWVMPSNTFMTSGSFDGYFSSAPTNYLNFPRTSYYSGDTNWWTNWVTAPNGTFLTSTTFATTVTSGNMYTNIWFSYNWYDYGWHTNVYWPTNYNSVIFTNHTTVDVAAGKLFAFERDKKALDWSTNAYSDMGRALSLMQWQGNEVKIEYMEIEVILHAYFTGAGTITWYGGSHAPTVSTNYGFGKIGTMAGIRNTSYFQANISLGQAMARVIVNNTSPFVWTNGYFYLTGTVNTNGYADPQYYYGYWPYMVTRYGGYQSGTGYGTPDGYQGYLSAAATNGASIGKQNFCVMPNQAFTGAWFVCNWDGSDGGDPATLTADMISGGKAWAEAAAAAGWLPVDDGPGYHSPFHEYQSLNYMLPQWDFHPDIQTPNCSYQVLFNTFLDYRNYAPVR